MHALDDHGAGPSRFGRVHSCADRVRRVSVSNRLPLGRRLWTAGLWPVGIALTSWHYLWRTTPIHRREQPGSTADRPPPLPAGLASHELQLHDDGVGLLYHRVYEVRIRQARVSPEGLIARLGANLNRASPTELARFFKVSGADGALEAGDELLVRMPGPWDGPVRVAEATPTSFRLVTLAGHLEAGQIEFRASERDGELRFAIESWARSGDRLSNLLYHHLRMAKEVQLHMWTSFLERVAELAGGRITGGIEIVSRRLQVPDAPA
jgi:uncharacterized protein DUF1990